MGGGCPGAAAQSSAGLGVTPPAPLPLRAAPLCALPTPGPPAAEVRPPAPRNLPARSEALAVWAAGEPRSGLGRDAVRPAVATLWGVLPAARTLSHSGAALGRTGEGSRPGGGAGGGGFLLAQVPAFGIAAHWRMGWWRETAPWGSEGRKYKRLYVLGAGEGGSCRSEAWSFCRRAGDRGE